MAQGITASTARRLVLTLWLLAITALPHLFAQAAPRIAGPIDASTHVALRGTVSPRLQSARDDGRVAGNLKLSGLTLVFTPSASQQADLKQLLIDQQTPGSSSYHVWLTPARYAARFGMGSADIAKVQNWLTAEGFAVGAVNNSRTRITFSGTAAQVESAFSTQLHHYSIDGETHLANANELQVPAALAGIAGGIENLTDFRLKPHVRRMSGAAATPNYTGSSNEHQMTPADLVTIYDIQPLYDANYDGTGQRIAIVGQSEILQTDVTSFRAAAGLAAKDPIPVLVPGTGISTRSSGDEVESDLDVEYSGAIARNADVYFVYTGSDTNYGVFDALAYAVDTNIAPVISTSYGTCEANLTTSGFSTLESIFAQANAQGETIFSASGDSGATDCDDSTSTPITSATLGLAVDYPASSQYVTGVGGTMFNEGSGSYWNASNTTAGGSAESYIPETAWNEATISIANKGGLLGGGGGVSTLTTKPTWQTGTGVPSDGFRDVPDIALDSAVYHDGYLYCSSDTETGVTGSCASGFLDSSGQILTIAGGTSFAAPITAGILALINEKTASNGQGNLNTQLYAFAASNPSAFHDVTTGNNSEPCTKGTVDCASGGTIGYSAGTGYDQATGLGSLDVAVFAGVFTTTTSGLAATTVTLTPADETVVAGTSVTITATVAATNGLATPTGTVQFAVDGTATDLVTLSGSVASEPLSSAIINQTGTHVITATYSGDASHASSFAVDTVTITAAASTGSGTFTLTSTNATAALGGSATSTITVTPAGGYTGTVGFTLSTTSTALQTYGCFDITSASLPSSAAVTTVLTLYTAESACTTTVSVRGRTLHRFAAATPLKKVAANTQPPPQHGFPTLPISAAAALGGALCFLRKRSRLWPLAAVFLLAGAALGAIGCGGGGSSTPVTPVNEVPAGSYSVTVTGADTTYTSITAATTLTLTVQ